MKNSALFANVKGKLNILWQWQFIAVVLPLLAALFFLLLAAVYIRASYNESGPPPQGESAMDQAIQSVRALLERETVSNLCSGGETISVDSSFILEELKMNQTMLGKVMEAVVANHQWGINVDGESWSVPGVRLPVWCSIKTYVWNISMATLVIIFGWFLFFILFKILYLLNFPSKNLFAL